MRALALASLLTCLAAQANDELVVVVSQASPVQQLSRAAVSALYLGNLGTHEADHDLKPLDLQDGDVRDDFYNQLLGRSRNQMRAYWSRMVFTGKGKPPRAYAANEVRQALQANPALIAYLPRSQLDATLRPLLTLP